MAARSGPAASWGRAAPVRPPYQPPPSERMRSEGRVLLPCRGNGLPLRRFRSQTVAFCLTRFLPDQVRGHASLENAMRFTISETESAKNVPSAASAAARSG
jgi:hypothetical protein